MWEILFVGLLHYLSLTIQRKIFLSGGEVAKCLTEHRGIHILADQEIFDGIVSNSFY